MALKVIYQAYTNVEGEPAFHQQAINDIEPVPEGWTDNLASVQPIQNPTPQEQLNSTLLQQNVDLMDSLDEAQQAIVDLTAAQLTEGDAE